MPAVDSAHVSTPAVSRARARALVARALAIALPVSAAPYEPYTPSKPDAAAAAAEKKRREAAWAASKTGWETGFRRRILVERHAARCAAQVMR